MKPGVFAIKTRALEPRILLARYFLASGKPEAVAVLFTNLDKAQQQAPEVLRLKAVAQLSNRDADAAQFTLEQLLESTPDSAQIRHMMAMAAAGSGDNERTRKELALALMLDEQYIPSRIALARVTLASGEQVEFEQHLNKLIELEPDNVDVLMLQAAAAKARGETETAVALVQRAFDTAPSATTLVALATYREASGDRSGARALYQSWIQEHPDDNAVRMAYANTLQLSKDFDAAGDQYDTVLKGNPDNVIALNNQAWILREDNPKLALQYSRKAAELAPDSGDVLDTLAVVEYHNDEFSRAKRSIERALAAKPGHPSMLYHSAIIDVALDNKEAARITLEKLLGQNPDFPEREQAERLLSTL